MTRRLVIAAAAAAVLVVAEPSPLRAQEERPRVLVLDFVGPDAQRLRPRVMAFINERYALVPVADYRRVFEVLGDDERQNEEILARLGRNIGVHAFVEGRVRVRRSARTLMLTVRNGADGSIIRTLRLPLTLRGEYTRDDRPQRAFTRALMPSLELAVEDAVLLHAEYADEDVPHLDFDEPEVIEQPGDEEESSFEDADDFADFDEFAAFDDPDAEGTGGGEPEGVAPGIAGIALEASVLMLSREFSLQGAPGTDSPATSTYNHIETHVDFAAFPLMHLDGAGVWRTLGVYGEVGYAVSGLGRTSFGAGVRYLTQADDQPTTASFRLSAGMARIETEADTDEDLPKLRYDALAAGAGARVPIGVFRGTLDVRYLRILSTGDLGRAENFGDGDSGGFVVDAGLEYLPVNAMTFRVGARYMRFGHRFDGRDEIAAQGGQPIVGADDVSLGGYLLTSLYF